MGKSYIIKYVAELDNGETTTQLYRMRYEDIIGDLAQGKNGLKAGQKIKVWRQTTGVFLGSIFIKKDIPKMQQDEDYRFINLPIGINWRNCWNISKRYWNFIK